MRTFGVLSALVSLAVATGVPAQESILVPTPSGGSVSVSLPPVPAAGQSYSATAQPMVVPVPITLNVTPSITQHQVPVNIPVPYPAVSPAPAAAPTFPSQQPPQPAGQACRPIDPYAPIPFELLDGPIRSTVLTPAGFSGQQYPASTAQNPLLPSSSAFPPQGQPQSAQSQPPFMQQPGMRQPAPMPPNPLLSRQPVPASTYPSGLYAPRAGVYNDPAPAPAPVPEPLTVPAPGIPYSLDSQGRPHYVQQPGLPVGPQQWPGYTPVNYPQQQQPVPPTPRFNQPPYPYGPFPGDPSQPYPSIQPTPGAEQHGQYYAGPVSIEAPSPSQQFQQQVPPGLNPALNPNLTNPNTPVQLVTPAQVNQAILEGTQMVILDVRGELVRDVIGHVPNDVHASLDPVETFPSRVRHVIPDARFPVVVYCNDGINSSRAANMLANMGYPMVYLMGIYTGWPGGGHIPPQACTSCPPAR